MHEYTDPIPFPRDPHASHHPEHHKEKLPEAIPFPRIEHGFHMPAALTNPTDAPSLGARLFGASGPNFEQSASGPSGSV